VGKGDMRAQLRQVGENLKAALAAAGATLNDLVKNDHICHRH
jgi:2-iminobutanoate/2-iminopropanoate deaminase